MRPRRWLLAASALAVAVLLATAVSPFASSSPDGLERVGEDEGFAAEGRLHVLQEDAPAPDYAFPGVEDERLATALAGLAGTLTVVAVAVAIAGALRRRRPRVATEARQGAAPTSGARP